MLCFFCKVNDATLSLKHVLQGKVSDINVCESCAEKHGFNVQLPIPQLTDFLFGEHAESISRDSLDESSCPSCHMNRSDFLKVSRCGCETCYETFSYDVTMLIENMQMGNRHMGKVPSSCRDKHIEVIKSEIKVADKMDDSLLATRLREHLTEIATRNAD